MTDDERKRLVQKWTRQGFNHFQRFMLLMAADGTLAAAGFSIVVSLVAWFVLRIIP